MKLKFPHHSIISSALLIFIDAVAFGALIPILPFVVLRFGGSPSVVAALVAAFGLASFASAPVLGRLSDRFGRGIVLAASLGISLVAFTGMLLAHTLLALFIFRMLSGAAAGRAGVLRTVVTDHVDQEGHVSRLGWLISAGSVGAVAGPALGAITAARYATPDEQFRAVIWVMTGLTLVSLVMALPIVLGRTGSAPHPALSNRNGEDGSARSRWITPLFGIVALIAYSNGVLLSVTALFVKTRFGWGATETGQLLAASALVVALARPLIVPRLAKRFGFALVLNAAIGAAGCGFLLISLTTVPWGFLVGFALFVTATSIINLLPMTRISMTADPARRGAIMGRAQAVLALSMAVSAFLSGLAFQWIGPGVPYVLGAITLAVASMTWFRLERTRARAPNVPRPPVR